MRWSSPAISVCAAVRRSGNRRFCSGRIAEAAVDSIPRRLVGFRDERMLVLVEPGTPAGFARIRDARAALIAAGGHVAAPCTHDNTCPIAGTDWCHFSERLPRSRDHLIAKGAPVPFEDERYAYVAVCRASVARPPLARIIKPVVEGKPGITLPLCEASGLRDQFRAAARQRRIPCRAQEGMGRPVLVLRRGLQLQRMQDAAHMALQRGIDHLMLLHAALALEGARKRRLRSGCRHRPGRGSSMSASGNASLIYFSISLAFMPMVLSSSAR